MRAKPTPPAIRPLRVLVADGNRDCADSLAELLELVGLESRACYDGLAVLPLADQFLPDVCVLDVVMPGMVGWELARRLGTAPKPPLLVAVTARGTGADRRRSAEAGIHLHLIKPVEPAVLVGVLRRFARAVHLPGASGRGSLFGPWHSPFWVCPDGCRETPERAGS